MDKIVIVEDDVLLRIELQDILEKAGYCVGCIPSFHNVLKDIEDADSSLILLDLNLPGISGFDICKKLKARGIGPILVLTSRNQLRDELHALDLGADDYLTKPCHPQRLVARIEKLLQLYANISVLLKVGNLHLDVNGNILYFGEKFISLSDNEGIIMKTLMKAFPSIVKKEELFRLVWGSSSYVDENILQVNMTRLRKDLQQVGLSHAIKTIRGIGYQLKEDYYK